MEGPEGPFFVSESFCLLNYAQCVHFAIACVLSAARERLSVCCYLL